MLAPGKLLELFNYLKIYLKAAYEETRSWCRSKGRDRMSGPSGSHSTKTSQMLLSKKPSSPCS